MTLTERYESGESHRDRQLKIKVEVDGTNHGWMKGGAKNLNTDEILKGKIAKGYIKDRAGKVLINRP